MSDINRPQGVPNTLSGTWAHVLVLLLAMLVGCQPARPLAPPLPSRAAVQEPSALWGRVSAGFQVQASATELVSYATVTLLDSNAQVVATGLTDAAGAFGLNPFVSWTPVSNAVYALDARKSFDRSNDQAGLRFRTLVSWDGSQWRSLAGSASGVSGAAGVLINTQTTALATIQGLRALAASSLLGSINPTTGTFTEAAGVTTSELESVGALVGQALAANLDPVHMLTYSNATYGLKLRPKAGGLLFDLEDALLVSGQGATMVQGKEGGRAIAVSNAIALYEGQFGSQGPAAGSFVYPQGVETDRFGNVFVSDYGNHRVAKFGPSGTLLSNLGAYGTGNGQFNGAHDVTLDLQGNLYVTDIENHRIQKFAADGTFLMGIGQGTVWGPATPAPAIAAGSANGWLNRPYSVEVDSVGNIYVSDQGNVRLVKFTASGQFVLGIGNGTTWGAATPAPAPAPGTANGYFKAGPWGFTLDRDANLYLVDHDNARIQKFTSGGQFVLGIGNGTAWGAATPAPAPAPGTANGFFNLPDTVALDQAGNLWVTDGYDGTGNNRLQKFDPNGAYLGQFGSQGAGNGQLHGPRGITFAPDGTLLVAEWKNNRVQRLIPAQTSLSFPGSIAINRTAGTVQLWLKPQWGQDTPGRYNLFELFNVAGPVVNGLSLYKTGGNLQMDYYGNATSGQFVSTPLAGWLPKTWHHVAVTWDAGSVQLYLDGKLAAGLTPTGPMAVTPTLHVGHNYQPAFHVNGVIDQFRTHDYAKSPGEIARDFRGLVQE